MKCAITVAPNRMEIREAPSPTAGPGEAVIHVEAVGICGSDYKLFHGTHPYSQFPQTQGHEVVGTISAFGPGAAGELSVGDRVAIEPLIPCSACYACRNGRYNCCSSLKVLGVHVPGGLAEEVAVRTSALYAVGGLAPAAAVLTEPVAVGLQCVVRGRVAREDRVVVLGAGPIGLAVVLGSVDRGATVLAADRIRGRLDAASRMGAARVVDTAAEDLDAVVGEFTDGDGASVVVEATGAPELLRQSFDLVAHGGRIVVVGISDRDVSIPVIEFSRKEVDILGSRNSAGIFSDAVALVRSYRDRLVSVVTHTVPLEDTASAIRYAIDHPSEVRKTVIRVDDAAWQ